MIFLISFSVFLLFVIAMAIGVILSNKPIKGSCGGLQQSGLKGKCSICGDEINNKNCKKADTTQ